MVEGQLKNNSVSKLSSETRASQGNGASLRDDDSGEEVLAPQTGSSDRLGDNEALFNRDNYVSDLTTNEYEYFHHSQRVFAIFYYHRNNILSSQRNMWSKLAREFHGKFVFGAVDCKLQSEFCEMNDIYVAPAAVIHPSNVNSDMLIESTVVTYKRVRRMMNTFLGNVAPFIDNSGFEALKQLAFSLNKHIFLFVAESKKAIPAWFYQIATSVQTP
jgi:hypothetical protein